MRISEHLILASRSPRRIELLRSLSPDIQIEVSPPPSSDEQGFGDCSTMEAILTRIEEIAIHKLAQVCDHRLSCGIASRGIVIAADTVVIVPTADGKFRVLGQPPETDDWQPTVRDWFTEYYAGKSHWVSSAVSMQTPAGKRLTGRATTTVTFREDVTCWLDWYLSTGESRGKAGGYAIQGLASIFVSRVEGSLSNVVGLPLEVLLQLFSSISESDHHGE